MTFGAATYGLGLVAGALSTLSPCVLPLVPVLIASAVNAHRWGALALGAGLALSFAIIGIFLATVGASLGLDPDTFRTAGAVILAIFGLILLVPKLQIVFATATGALSNTGNEIAGARDLLGVDGAIPRRIVAGCRVESLRRSYVGRSNDTGESRERFGSNRRSDADLRRWSRRAIGVTRVTVARQLEQNARPFTERRQGRQARARIGHAGFGNPHCHGN